MLIKFPKKIDKEIFKDNYEGQTKYGLPKKVLFCKSCVISNQRPNSSIEFKHKKASKKNTINFDENLICDACKVKEKKAMINSSNDNVKPINKLAIIPGKTSGKIIL